MMTGKRMRKTRRYAALALTLMLVLLSGCGLMEGVQQVDQTLDYVNGATEYVTQAAAWTESLPAMAEQAVLDPAVRDQLIAELNGVLEQIQAFSALDAPTIAEELHAQLIAYNNELRAEVEAYLAQLNDQTADLQAIGETRMMELLELIGLSADRLREIGQ